MVPTDLLDAGLPTNLHLVKTPQYLRNEVGCPAWVGAAAGLGPGVPPRVCWDCLTRSQGGWLRGSSPCGTRMHLVD